mgnify:CR=1 FL=1
MLLLREKLRRKASTSLHEFVAQAWHVVEPTVELKDNWHIQAISEHLEAVDRGEIRRLLINVPFRTAKSTIVGVMWPAWTWVHKPGHKWLCGSYAAKLAIRDNLKMRRLIQSPWYRERWGRGYNLVDNSDWGDPGGFELTGDQNQKMRFENDRSGYRIAFGFEGGVMGDGGDCLAGETLVATEEGTISIRQLHERSMQPRVWSRRADGTIELRRIVATRVISSRRTITVFVGTTRIECTDEHHFWTRERGFVPAREIDGLSVLRWADEGSERSGDSLWCVRVRDDRMPGMRTAVRSALVGTAETREKESELDAYMLPTVRGGHGSSTLSQKTVSVLRHALSCARKWKELLLSPLRTHAHQRGEAQEGVVRSPLRHVRHDDEDRQLASALLWARVQERGSQRTNDGRQELSLHDESEPLRAVSENPTTDQDSRWERLRRLQRARTGGEGVDGSSHRSRPDEQQADQSRDALRKMSHPAPQIETATARVDHGIVGHHRRKPVDVYDIQVEGNHNFFAGGVLVHNCILIDDPHDRDKAHSEAERENALTTFSEAVTTRLNDPAKSSIVIIMQRLHQQDLSGLVLAQGTYEHLLIPMEYDPKRSKTTCIGFTDPRKVPGELLHQERFPAHVVAEIKTAIGSYAAAGQLNQAPAPPEGGIFKRTWWRFYDVLPADLDEEIQSWDLALKGTAGSDFVAGQAWARKGAKFYLKDDEVYERQEFPETIASMLSFSVRHPNGAKLVEDKANGPAAVATLRDRVPGIIAVNPAGDKAARARAVSPYVEAGNVYLPNPYDESGNPIPGRSRVLRLIENAATYPNGSIPSGSHGDDIDALTQALHRLTHGGGSASNLAAFYAGRAAQLEEQKAASAKKDQQS